MASSRTKVARALACCCSARDRFPIGSVCSASCNRLTAAICASAALPTRSAVACNSSVSAVVGQFGGGTTSVSACISRMSTSRST